MSEQQEPYTFYTAYLKDHEMEPEGMQMVLLKGEEADDVEAVAMLSRRYHISEEFWVVHKTVTYPNDGFMKDLGVEGIAGPHPGASKSSADIHRIPSYPPMKVKELKSILRDMPDNASILLGANGHYNFTDTRSHGRAIAAHVTIQGEDVFVLSATSCDFHPCKLNYRDIELIKILRK